MDFTGPYATGGLPGLTKKVLQVVERQLFVFCRDAEATRLVVQHSSCTPGAPYGSSFRVELGFTAALEAVHGKAGLVLSFDSHVHFLQRTMMQRLIKRFCPFPPR